MSKSEFAIHRSRVDSITKIAIDIFESVEAANIWMRQPNRALGEATPIDLLDSDVGAAQVKQVLNAIKTGGVI
jgi:putative toxin-antitoxin system antitoxin component (TIGR02293 family)